VGLSGDFRETSFADLIQFYGISKQSVAVVVSPGDGSSEGVFHFQRGDLVSARFGAAQGREALRRALRLRDGTFSVAAVDAKPLREDVREPWTRVVLEELVRIDEEDRAHRVARSGGSALPTSRAAGAFATGPAVSTPPPSGSAPAPLGSRQGPEAKRPAGGPPAGAPPRASADGVVPPVKRKSVAGLVLLLVGGGAVLVIAAIVYVLMSPQARNVDTAVDRLLEPPPPARGVGQAEVLLGMASPFSGANRELGRSIKAGIESAIGEVNASGGVNGRKLRLVAVDDGYEPSRTVPTMRQLLDEQRVFAVVGNVGTPTAAVSIPMCQERKVVFFGALSGGDLLRKHPPDRYVFNFRPSYAEETAAAVRFLADVRRIPPQRIAVFAQQDEFGESGWRGAERELTDRGVDGRSILRVGYKRNTADVVEAIAALRQRARDVDAVVMVATYKAAATFVRKARDAGLSFVTTNVSAVDANALAEELVGSGARYAAEVIVTQIVPLPTSRSSAVMRFQKALAEHGGGEQPGFLALEGWIVGHLFAEGLRRAGADVDGEKLVAALETIRDLDLGIGTRISFSSQEHQGSHKVWGTQLQPDGTWRQIELE
jgi:ABC-type branched-subunit amino acid transport system substrate-binding protein